MTNFAVIGLGYVGLGLAVALSKKNSVIGYDINEKRIAALRQHIDYHQLIPSAELSSPSLIYTDKVLDIKSANFFIVSVATPAYFYESPNLKPLLGAVADLATILKKGDIVVFESTVYPGTTEFICIPELEKLSQLKNGIDFHVGYSPERINPGDTIHTLKTTTKIVAAQRPDILKVIQEAYATICDDVYPVSSIAVAEATKILENTQRDVNIALMNEFTKIMHGLNLDTHEIIEAAKTKWGFVPFKPGFVGGHCISIDPHYLAFVAKRHGVHPDLILTARKINDGMTQFVVQSMLKLMTQQKLDLKTVKIGLFGVTYKENVMDCRNSLALKLLKELCEFGFCCEIHDPIVTEELPCVKLMPFDKLTELSVAIIVVGHEAYRTMGLQTIVSRCKSGGIVMDIPNLFVDDHQQFSDLLYWNL